MLDKDAEEMIIKSGKHIQYPASLTLKFKPIMKNKEAREILSEMPEQERKGIMEKWSMFVLLNGQFFKHVIKNVIIYSLMFVSAYLMTNYEFNDHSAYWSLHDLISFNCILILIGSILGSIKMLITNKINGQ